MFWYILQSRACVSFVKIWVPDAFLRKPGKGQLDKQALLCKEANGRRLPGY